MTVTTRRIRATPHRTATEAWELISNLLAPDGQSSARKELMDLAGIAGHAIASESPKESPIVVRGKGPRIRFYCLYDEDAMSGDDANENAFASTPTDAEWRMSIPVQSEDLGWVKAELEIRTERVTARTVGESIEEDDDDDSSRTAAAAKVNVDVFLKA